jgi:hypothetical protein
LIFVKSAMGRRVFGRLEGWRSGHAVRFDEIKKPHGFFKTVRRELLWFWSVR